MELHNRNSAIYKSSIKNFVKRIKKLTLVKDIPVDVSATVVSFFGKMKM